MKDDILKELIAFIVIQTISLIILFTFNYNGWNPFQDSMSQIIAILVINVIVAFIVLFFYRNKARVFLKDLYSSSAINKYGPYVGLVSVYESFPEAKKDIVKSFEKATDIKILLQLGRGIIGGNNSLLFEAAKRKTKEVKMQLLYADDNSKYLSEEVAKARRSVRREWLAAIKYNEGNIEALKEKCDINLETKTHCEPYLWRLFFFDNDLFLVPYLYKQNNDEKAPVFRFRRTEEENSLFQVFSIYFDELWSEQESKKISNKSVTN